MEVETQRPTDRRTAREASQADRDYRRRMPATGGTAGGFRTGKRIGTLGWAEETGMFCIMTGHRHSVLSCAERSECSDDYMQPPTSPPQFPVAMPKGQAGLTHSADVYTTIAGATCLESASK